MQQGRFVQLWTSTSSVGCHQRLQLVRNTCPRLEPKKKHAISVIGWHKHWEASPCLHEWEPFAQQTDLRPSVEQIMKSDLRGTSLIGNSRDNIIQDFLNNDNTN